MPAKLSDSRVSETCKPKVSGVDAMYDIATGHNVGPSSSASSEFHCESSVHAEQLKQENKQLRMTINAMEQDMELEVAQAKETTRNEMLQVYKQEMAIRDTMIKLLEVKVALLDRNTKAVNSEESTILSVDSLVPNEVNNEEDTSSDPLFRPAQRKLTLPSLSQFSGSKEQDGDAFDRWVCKLSKYAESES